MKDILTIKEISKEYTPGKKALDSINLTFSTNEFVSIIGKSGAGKSTLLRCINHLIEPTQGEIIYKGSDTRKMSNNELRILRREIAMIFQHYNLIGRLSVLTNTLHGRLGYMGNIQGLLGLFSTQDKIKACEILEKLEMKEHIFNRCDQLSGGQKQRVGIARALIQNPAIMLCDEPIASLDPSTSRTIMDILKRINQDLGITIICNLHQVDVAVKYSERIIGIKDGQVVFDGTPSELNTETIHYIYGTDYGELIMDREEK